jgi:hypothetical protein
MDSTAESSLVSPTNTNSTKEATVLDIDTEKGSISNIHNIGHDMAMPPGGESKWENKKPEVCKFLEELIK